MKMKFFSFVTVMSLSSIATAKPEVVCRGSDTVDRVIQVKLLGNPQGAEPQTYRGESRDGKYLLDATYNPTTNSVFIQIIQQLKTKSERQISSATSFDFSSTKVAQVEMQDVYYDLKSGNGLGRIVEIQCEKAIEHL